MKRLIVFMFFLYCGIAIFVSFMPLYYQNQGLSKTEIGAILGIGSFVSIFAQPFWGIVSDRTRTVKRIIQLLLVAALVLGFALFSFKTTGLLMIAAFVFFIFHSAIPALTDSLAVSTAQENGRQYGKFRLWGDAGVGFSSLVFGLVVAYIGIEYLGWMYAGIMIICIVVAMYLKDAATQSVPITRKSILSLMTNLRFLWLMTLVLLTSLPHRMNDGLLGVYMTSMNGSESQVGIAWSVATFSSLPAFALMGILLRYKKDFLILAIASLVYAVRWYLQSVIHDPNWMIIIQVLQGITFPVFLVTAIHIMTQIVPVHLRNTGQTTFAAIFGGVAGILGSTGGGWIMDNFEPSTAYLIGSGISLLAAICTGVTYIWNQRYAKTESNKVSA